MSVITLNPNHRLPAPDNHHPPLLAITTISLAFKFYRPQPLGFHQQATLRSSTGSRLNNQQRLLLSVGVLVVCIRHIHRL